MAIQAEKVNLKKGSPLLLPLILLLPILLIAVGSRQILHQRAADAPRLANFKLSVDRGIKKTNDSFPVNLEIRSTQEEKAMAVGATLKFNPKVFEATELACGENWPQTAKAEVASGTINLSCFRAKGNQYFTIQPGVTAILGRFDLRVKDDSPVGTSRITFTRMNVPDKGTGENHAGDGEMAVFTIVTGSCELKVEGDADCNGILNIADFASWRKEFMQYLREGGAAGEGWVSDFDLNGVINVADFSTWLNGFLSKKGEN